MSSGPPAQITVYHLTDGKNLKSILSAAGLYSKNELLSAGSPKGGPAPVDISNPDIQDRRRQRRVPIRPDTTLHDYVPFYLCPRSPMLYALQAGYVSGWARPQRALVYLVSRLPTIDRYVGDWIFTDGHAVIQKSQFYERETDFEQLDWEVIASHSWANTLPDGDRKRRKQAEFLVRRHVPWLAIERIGVMDAQVRQRVEEITRDSAHRPQVRIERKWYY